MRPERILWWRQALYLLSLEDDHAGQHEQADARRRGLGLLRDFWVLGPFDAQGRSGLERIYPAELALPDPRGGPCYSGKTHEVCWRRTSPEWRARGRSCSAPFFRVVAGDPPSATRTASATARLPTVSAVRLRSRVSAAAVQALLRGQERPRG